MKNTEFDQCLVGPDNPIYVELTHDINGEKIKHTYPSDGFMVTGYEHIYVSKEQEMLTGVGESFEITEERINAGYSEVRKIVFPWKQIIGHLSVGRR